MYYLLVKFKEPNTTRWVEWNTRTFPMRRSMGLVSVIVYKDEQEEESYFAMSIWRDKQSAQKYLSDDQVSDILKSPEIEWHKELSFDAEKSMVPSDEYEGPSDNEEHLSLLKQIDPPTPKAD